MSSGERRSEEHMSNTMLNEGFRMARKAVRVSQRLVAATADVSRPTVSAIERKGREPRVGELVSLASLFRVSPEVLMRGDLVEAVGRADTVDASFRAEGGKHLHRQDAWELDRIRTDLITSVPCVTTDGATGVPTARACKAIREQLHLDDDPPFDVFRALYNHGYNLVFTALSSISGALIRGKPGQGGCAIVVNSDQPDDRQRWTAAHEVAHVACGHDPQAAAHIDLYGPARSRIDQEADIVAGELLMPRQEVHQRILDVSELTPEAMYKMADAFHVSYAAMVVRCGTLNLIASHQVTDLRKAKPSKLEAQLGLKEQRTTPFDPDSVMPEIVDQLGYNGLLPSEWHLDFSTSGPIHVRRLQAAAARHYVTSTDIGDRRTSVTELFEEVAAWLARTYPWAA